MIFQDRHEAGKKLADKLKIYKNNLETIVLGLPRGGVIVAHEVAQILKLPLDIIITRKIGTPNNKELALGAIDDRGNIVLNKNIISTYNIPLEYINSTITHEKEEIKRRIKKYRQNKNSLELKNKNIIIIDDGIATGATMQAAIISVKKQQPQKIIVAVPVLAQDNVEKIKKMVDELIYLSAPLSFLAVGNFYKKFDQTSDREVTNLLKNNLVTRIKNS